MQQQIDDLRTKRRRHCHIFLSQVAWYVSKNYYILILCHATSLERISEVIKRDHNMKTSGINFLSLLKISSIGGGILTNSVDFSKIEGQGQIISIR